MAKRRHVRSALVVDDDKEYLGALPQLLRDREVFVMNDDRRVLYWIRTLRPDLLLMDCVLGDDRDGLQAIKRIKRAGIDVPVALVSAGMPATIVEAMQRRAGANVVVWPKPFSPEAMDVLIERMETSEPLAARSVDNVESFADVRRQHARSVVSLCGGNKSEAARRLHVSRPTLLRALGAKPPR